MKKNKITIEWYSIIKDVVRNIWVVVLSALIAAMGTYIVSHKVYTPEYTSSATLVVSANGNSASYSLYSVSSEMAGVLINIFNQPAMKTKAAENIGAESFNGTISAAVKSDTNFIGVKVTAGDPQTAYDLLCSVLEVYPQISNNIFKNAHINTVRNPSVPSAPSNSSSAENSSIIISCTAALVLLIIVILSITRDTVKNTASFNDRIEAKLIGSVIHESKNLSVQDKIHKKKKGLLIHGNAFISLRFVESFHKIAAKLEYMNRQNGDKVFAVTSVAENEGKSTAAANIAVSLADRGNRVILVDLDGKKPALYKIFGEEYEESSELANLLGKKISMGDFRLRRYKKSSLYLALNTNPHPEYHQWIANGYVEKILGIFKTKADYIIIDTAPVSADSSVTDIAKMVDKTVMVVRTDTVPVATLNDTISTLGKISANFAGCILNDVHPDVLPFSFSGNDESNYYGKKYGKYGKYGGYYGHYGHYANHEPTENH